MVYNPARFMEEEAVSRSRTCRSAC